MTPELPVVSGREAIRVFEQLGHSIVRQRTASISAPSNGSLEKAAEDPDDYDLRRSHRYSLTLQPSSSESWPPMAW